MTYQCKTCGNYHEGLPDIGYRYPDTYFTIPESEREARTKFNTDLCSIDDEHFFIRGVLLIPVLGQDEQLGLGVWVSQSQENFETYVANYDTDEIGPFFGWLSNSLPFYDQDTWALKTMAHFQGNGQRPLIVLEPSDHALFKDIESGISLERAWEYVHQQDGNGDA